MSDPSKITLFNFRTSRSPELLSPQARQDYFVEHPSSMEATSSFFTGVANKGPGVSTREAMETAAAAFTPLSLDDIKALNPNLYNFALTLLSSRNTITKDEANIIITDAQNPVTPLNAGDEANLWDNLFYQTIEQDDQYCREAILYLIVANHFVIKFNFATIDDTGTQKLAQSRAVMPVNLFKLDDDYRSASTEAEIGPNGILLEKYISSLESNLLAIWAESALNEMSVVESTYWATEKQNEQSAVATYISAMESNVMAAPTSATVDQFSGFTFPLFSEPVTEPTLSYSPSAQISLSNIQASISSESYYLLNTNNLLNQSTFSAVNVDIKSFIKGRADKVFANTDFGLESIDVNGTAVPTCNIENRYNQKYSYMFRSLKKATDTYALMLAVDIGSACTHMRDMSIEIGNPVSQTFTRFKASNQNGIITIHVTEGNMASINDALSQIASTGELKFDNGLVLNFSDDLEMDEFGTTGYMVPSDGQSGNTDVFIPSGYGLTQLGIDEYRKVEQYLCCYVPGEVSHIENVMAREYKERSTRRLRRSEDTTTVTTESESENLTDTTSTSRFDMQKETAEVLSQSRELGVHADVYANASGSAGAGSLGEVSFSAGIRAGANFAASSSKEKSSRQAANFAQDVTQKALQRVVQKVSQQRTTKIIEEFEETNRHGFDNRKGSAHISGIYRWVDKVYKNEVRNYGKRLQYEFMIPEPAAFHLIAKKRGVSNSTKASLVKPLDPRTERFGSLRPLKSAANITEHNYQQWAAIYNAEVSPPPPKIKVIGKSYKKEEPDPSRWSVPYGIADQVVIPEGYGLNKAYVSGLSDKAGISWARFNISIGDNSKRYWTDNLKKTLFLEDNKTLELDKYTDTIPVAVAFYWLHGGVVNISLELIRKSEHYHAWQLETFRAIVSAYEEKMQDYNDAIAEMEAKRDALLSDNPKYYREIEQIVLKKNCISYLVGHTNMGKSFVKGSKMGNQHVEISQAMDQYAASVKFFEQAFEWGLMSYKFYPFYWAGKNKWTQLYDIDNDDSIFKAFLQAGMARVVVTVRPGFEESVMHYMATGQIWDGGEVPVIGDDLYMSIVEEMKDPDYTIDYTWESRVPSTLTLIQKDIVSLNASGLPCYCDTGTPPTESIDNDDTTLGALSVFIEGDTTA